MQAKIIKEIEQEYEIELDRIVKEIKRQKAKLILLQFPDGMKPYAAAIAEHIEKRAPKTEILIWLSSCFGACDIPQFHGINPEIDLVIQFGHSAWNYDRKSSVEVLK